MWCVAPDLAQQVEAGEIVRFGRGRIAFAHVPDAFAQAALVDRETQGAVVRRGGERGFAQGFRTVPGRPSTSGVEQRTAAAGTAEQIAIDVERVGEFDQQVALFRPGAFERGDGGLELGLRGMQVEPFEQHAGAARGQTCAQDVGLRRIRQACDGGLGARIAAQCAVGVAEVGNVGVALDVAELHPGAGQFGEDGGIAAGVAFEQGQVFQGVVHQALLQRQRAGQFLDAFLVVEDQALREAPDFGIPRGRALALVQRDTALPQRRARGRQQHAQR